MKLLPFRQSLRAKILIAVILCAVAPLAAVGVWLTSAAARSGELLLRSQLDSTVARAATTARERWRHRRSDALLLAGNEPLRSALRAPTGTTDLPAFVRRAYETMPTVAAVVIRDAVGETRWTLGDVPSLRVAMPSGNDSGAIAGTPHLSIRIPIQDGAEGPTLGNVLVFVRVDALVSAAAAAPDQGSSFLAVHDRSGGGWLHPVTLLPSVLDARRFTWAGHGWIAVRRSLDAPPLDLYAAAALDPFVQPFAHTAAIGAAAIAIVGASVIALTILVTGRLTGSLASLARAADAMARGDLEARVDARSTDEVGRVARTFNTMAESIRRMMHELSQREAVAAMGELAATLAHQVRSPVTAMRLDVERVHRRLDAESPERALLGRALEQLDRLERAVDGSLKVARSAVAEFGAVDVREPLGRAIAGTVHEDLTRDVHIDSSRVSPAPLLVRGDAPSLEQLFTNVLTNAVHAARTGGRVSVAAAASGNAHLRVTIHDDGAGMTEDALARAGEPFFSTKAEGTGLGLAIGRRIAAAHRGTLTIESAAGAGTTVSIELPMWRA